MTPSIKRLDLIGIVSPVCLLKSKSVLSKMNSGELLEIIIKDPDVVDELVKIIERSKDQVIKSEPDGNHFRVCIKKS